MIGREINDRFCRTQRVNLRHRVHPVSPNVVLLHHTRLIGFCDQITVSVIVVYRHPVDAFLKNAPDLLKVYVPIKLLTGLRQQDLLALRREHLKDDGIHVEIKKTRKKIIIEWSDALKESLDAALKLKRPVFSLNVFCNRRGQEYTGDGFRSIWQRAMKNAIENEVITERFTEHDLRAKAATDAHEIGLDAQALLGHMDGATTRRYLSSKIPSRVKPSR